MTGCYPDMVGVPGVIRTKTGDNWGYLDPSAITLPQMLRKAGYHTALIGKWHLGLESPNLPNERGFDFFHGFLGDMMDDYMNHRREGINFMRLNREEIDPRGHATDLFADWAAEYIRDQAYGKKPFFLYLSFNAPHFPIQPPEEWLGRVREREKDKPEIRQKTIALVEHMDFCIGKVIKTLQETGQYGNTIIIFTSDNGGHLPSGASNLPLRGGKQDMYEGGIRVPACMVWEKMIKSGSVSNQTGCTMDFFPTLCSAAGVKIDHAIDGIDLLPGILAGKDNTIERTLFFMRREGGAYGGLCYYAALRGGYKLLQNTPYEPLQLFNIVSDPLEQHPLDGNNKHFGELKAALTQHIRKAGAVAWQRAGEDE